MNQVSGLEFPVFTSISFLLYLQTALYTQAEERYSLL